MSIDARWEWRAFGDEFGAAETEILSRVTSTRCSEETYLVSDRRDINVKIRGGELDIKRLVQVDATGLQQWTPILKRPFPIDSTTVVDVYRLWQVASPDSRSGSYSEDGFVTLVRETPGVSV